MKLAFTERFLQSYRAAPTKVRQAIDKQLTHLLRDLRHPSLRAKKYDESRGVWQARIDRAWRFYFRIQGDTYMLLDVMAHPK